MKNFLHFFTLKLTLKKKFHKQHPQVVTSTIILVYDITFALFIDSHNLSNSIFYTCVLESGFLSLIHNVSSFNFGVYIKCDYEYRKYLIDQTPWSSIKIGVSLFVSHHHTMFQLIHLNTSCLLVCGLFGLLFVNELPLQHDLSAGCKLTPCVRSIVSPWARKALSVDFSNACHCCTASLKASTMFLDILADVSMKLDMLNSWHQIETASGVTSRLAGETSFWRKFVRYNMRGRMDKKWNFKKRFVGRIFTLFPTTINGNWFDVMSAYLINSSRHWANPLKLAKSSMA